MQRGAMVYGIGAMLTLASQIVLARVMGTSEYGTYYYIMTWLLVLGLFIRFGMDNVYLRYLPVFIQGRDWGAVNGLTALGTRVVNSLAFLAGLGILGGVLLLPGQADASTSLTFLTAIPGLFLMGWMYLRQAVLRSLKHISRSLLPEAMVVPSVLMALVALLHALGMDINAPQAMVITMFALALAAVLGFIWQSRAMPHDCRGAAPRQETARWLGVAWAMLVINGMHLLLNNLDVLILGMYRPASEVGVYGVAARVAFLVAFPLTIANAVFAPLIAERCAANQREALQRVLSHGMRFVALAALLVLGVVVGWGEYLLAIFGDEFVAGKTVLVTLASAQLVNALCGPVALLLAQCGQERLVARVMVVATLLAGMLDMVLIPHWGMQGAAWSTACSIAGWNLTLLALTRMRLNFDATGWLHSVWPGRGKSE